VLDQKQKGQLETLLVEMILSFRTAFLRAQKGRPPLDYWDRMQARIRVAAQTTQNASEWASAVQRKLQLEGLDSLASHSLVDLAAWCDEHAAHDDCMELVSRDHAMLMALARVKVDAMKSQLREQVAPGNPPIERNRMEETARRYGLLDEETP